MKLLLDECLPRKLKLSLPGHDVRTVAEAGWSGVKNGALLKLAEQQFDGFITMDKNLRFQQRLSGRSIFIVVLRARDNALKTCSRLWRRYFLLCQT